MSIRVHLWVMLNAITVWGICSSNYVAPLLSLLAGGLTVYAGCTFAGRLDSEIFHAISNLKPLERALRMTRGKYVQTSQAEGG